MKDLMMLVVLSVLAVLAWAGSAGAAALSDFSIDSENWTGDTCWVSRDASPGADGDDGWLSCGNSSSASLYAAIDAVAPNPPGPAYPEDFLGDLAAKHGAGGTVLDMGFSLKYLLNYDTYTGAQYRIFTGSSPNASLWMKNVGPSSLNQDEWVDVTTTIDTAWTNAEAQANGWVQNGGTATFSQTFADVVTYRITFLSPYPEQTPPPPPSQTTWGFDNIFIQAPGGGPTPKNPGDVDEDNFVGGADLTTILTNWGNSGVGWTDGDVDPYNDGITTGDDFIGGGDYTAVLTAWGTSYGPEAIPEPATMVLLLVGTMASLIRRR